MGTIWCVVRSSSAAVVLRLVITVTVKPADENAQHKNLRVWDVATATEVAGFTAKSIDGW